MDSDVRHSSRCFPWLCGRKKGKAPPSLKEKQSVADDLAKASVNSIVDEGVSPKDAVPSKKAYAFEARSSRERGFTYLTFYYHDLRDDQLSSRMGGGTEKSSCWFSHRDCQNCPKDPEDDPFFKSSQGLLEEFQELKVCLISIMTRLRTTSNQTVLLTTARFEKTHLEITLIDASIEMPSVPDVFLGRDAV